MLDDTSITIRRMINEDIDLVFHALHDQDVSKPRDYIQRCWDENTTGKRITLVALHNDSFAGWLHLLSESNYPYFMEQGIPEINNFDVMPSLRRQGIGSALMDTIEQIAFERYDVIGIGVGLYPYYGNAQRLYVKRGYVPDERGIFYDNVQVVPGSLVRADDDLVLFLTKDKQVDL
ncbi:N-acetyltransferase [Paenibacillus sp. CCS19]|uniref:GNAT family N-acetyltransferase n=1 Tax=Paenibacillus sp. CCS19 TaxID=3158387 RepID=UPI00256E8463|nr:GNAT family N-acetyltransferase [Paenibacillus cellulosilyticus]GMK39468.1 N-acetyltransferase [Paenibacillus cellulosilyticus]